MLREPWGVRHGSWWLFQWSWDRTVGVGIHIDPCRRESESGPYGPFCDLHLGPAVLSLGYHPARANGLVTLLGQGGIMRPERG